MRRTVIVALVLLLLDFLLRAAPALTQLIDRTQNLNNANLGGTKQLGRKDGGTTRRTGGD